MINRTLCMWLSIFALLGAGCANSQRPRATPFPSAEIRRIDSAQHWDVMAEQLSIDLAAKYGEIPPDIKRMLYVEETDSSVFSKSLKSLLTTHLVAKGIPITTRFDRPTDNCGKSIMACTPLRMKLDIQIVHHDGINIPFPYKGVSLPKVASYVLYLVGDYWTSPIWAVLPLSEYIKNDYPAETNTEIIVNTLLLNGDKVVLAYSSIYYVNDNDSTIYQGHPLTGYTQPHIAPAPYNMEKSAIGTAAREGGCDYTGSTKLIQQGARVQTYEVHCRNSNVTVRCEEYDHCHVVL